MRAVVTGGAAGPLHAANLPDPQPAAGELLVRVRACGICGSDLHLSDALDVDGLVLGHEFCGEVADVGAGVEGWAAGDRLAGFPLVGCGTCPACLTGTTSRCASAAQLGLHRPGAFAEYTTLAASSAFRLPEALDDAHGALVEPLAVAHHALDRLPRAPEEPVLVLGGGPVGAAVALWARHLGARHVMVSDPVAHRRELAARAGATATVDPTTEDVASAFAAATGGLPRAVVECVGVPGMIQHAMDVAATDAHVTVVGVCMGPDEITPLSALFKELSVTFVLYYAKRDFAASIAALSSGALVPQPLLTGSVGLDDLPGRFESLKQPTTDCKVMVLP